MFVNASKLSGCIGYIEVLRPINTAFLMLITVFTPHIIGVTLTDLQRLSLIFVTISFGLVSAGAYALNDYYDVEIDKINKPYKPIPRGAVSSAKVRDLGILLTVAGVLVSLFSLVFGTILPFLSLCAYTTLLALYNKKYKKSILKNVLIGVACSFSVVVGAAVAQSVNFISILVIIFIFLTTIARELYKDIEDLRGDRALKIHTLPSLLGPQTSALLASGFLAVVIALSPLLYLLGFMNLKEVSK